MEIFEESGRLYGYLFSGIESSEVNGTKARFVMNRTMKAYYPEDDDVGSAWIKQSSV